MNESADIARVFKGFKTEERKRKPGNSLLRD